MAPMGGLQPRRHDRQTTIAIAGTMSKITILKRPAPSDDAPGVGLQRYQRKTARGKVLRVVRERYLREDVGCGSPHCSACSPFHTALRKTVATSEGRALTLLGTTPLSTNTRLADGQGNYYLLIDTNIVLHQMDLLEAMLPADASGPARPAFTNVIVLQTVLDEVRHRSMPLFNRLQALIQEPERHFWVYWNQFSAYVSLALFLASPIHAL